MTLECATHASFPAGELRQSLESTSSIRCTDGTGVCIPVCLSCKRYKHLIYNSYQCVMQEIQAPLPGISLWCRSYKHLFQLSVCAARTTSTSSSYQCVLQELHKHLFHQCTLIRCLLLVVVSLASQGNWGDSCLATHCSWPLLSGGPQKSVFSHYSSLFSLQSFHGFKHSWHLGKWSRYSWFNAM